MRDFAGRVAFITGGASGAGFGQATVFGRAGARIAIADVRPDALDDAVARLTEAGIEARGFVLDITDRAAYARVADAVEEHFGDPVTLLFNTAGVNGFGPIESMTYEDFDWIMGVNLGGVINGMQTFTEPQVLFGINSANNASSGGPGGAGLTAILYFYREAFNNNDYGYGAAIAWAVFVVILLFTAINWRLVQRRERGL